MWRIPHGFRSAPAADGLAQSSQAHGYASSLTGLSCRQPVCVRESLERVPNERTETLSVLLAGSRLDL